MGMWRLIADDIREWKRIGFVPGRPAEERLRLREALTLYNRFAGVRATVLFRISQAASRKHIPFIPGMFTRLNLRRYGLDAVSSLVIGPGLYIPHPVGTVIMATSIGSHCHIIHGVTIGMRTTPEFPVIGDHVTIGAGARVLGGITIGDGATIGANAVVIHDVPAGATAVGIPARITQSARYEATAVYARGQ